MNILDAIEARHSVRSYKDDPIPDETRDLLNAYVKHCNKEGNLHISIQYDDPDGFDSRLAHYGNFRNVKNYIVLAGKPGDDFSLRCGYYGEKIVLYAQKLGLNTCWVALTFNKRKVKKLLVPGEALCMVISLGYGETQGIPHRSRSFDNVVKATDYPDWFKKGVEAALLAPTATNQQKFLFAYNDGNVTLSAKGIGPHLETDLGIVKYHFEAGSGYVPKIAR